MNSSSKIKRGVILSYVKSILNILIGLLFTPWLIRSLGSSDYGLYALATSFVSYFLVDFGLGNSVAKYLASYRATHKEQDIKDFLGVVYKAYIIICFVLFIVFTIVYLNVDSIFKGLTVEEAERFKYIFIVVALYNTLSFPFNAFNGVLTAYEEFGPLRMSEIIQKASMVILMTVALLMGYGVFALVVVQVISGTLSIVYKYYYVKRCHAKVNWLFYSGEKVKEILSFSLWVCLLGICLQLIYGFQTTILGIVSDTKNISVYNISHTIYGFIYIFASGLNGLFLPRLSYIENEENSIEITNNLMTKVGRVQLLLLGLLISGFFVYGKEFLILWVGEEYVDAYFAGLLLIVPTLFVLTEEIPATLLYVKGNIKVRALMYVCATLICSILAYFLSPKYGAIGASMAVCVGVLAFDLIGMNIVYKNRMNLDVIGFFKNCHLKFLLPLCFCVCFGYILKYVFPVASWIYMGWETVIFGCCYITVMWFLFMNNYEKSLIINIFKKSK